MTPTERSDRMMAAADVMRGRPRKIAAREPHDCIDCGFLCVCEPWPHHLRWMRLRTGRARRRA